MKPVKSKLLGVSEPSAAAGARAALGRGALLSGRISEMKEIKWFRVRKLGLHEI